jgi:hypothetical protein
VENRTVIKHHEHYHPRPAQSFLNRTFEFSKGSCGLGCLPELDHIGMPKRRHDRLKRLGRRYTEPFDFDLSDRHLRISFILATSLSKSLDHPLLQMAVAQRRLRLVADLALVSQFFDGSAQIKIGHMP